MDIKICVILLLFVAVILLDYRHNYLENLKNNQERFVPASEAPFPSTLPPQPLTKNCRLTENKQPYNYPQPSDKYASVAQECISQQEFKNKNYYDLNEPLLVNARMTGYPRQPRPIV